MGAFIPSQVRNARIGAYPNSIKEFIVAGNLGAALDVVNQWDETFPTDKPNGHTFFWRGKLLELRGQPQEAARSGARRFVDGRGGVRIRGALAAGPRPGTDWCTEDAKKELAKLVASGISDEYTKKAKEKLQKALDK